MPFEEQYRTFKAEGAIPKDAFVMVVNNDPDELTVDVATAPGEAVGTAASEAFAAGDRISVILFDITRNAIASAAIAPADYVDITAAGKIVTGVLGAAHVALSTAALDGDTVEIAETK